MLHDATVLITGGTGSFGQTMARYLVARGCREIRIFSRDETKQDAMRLAFGAAPLRFHLGDVRDADSTISATRGVDYVFHAAALKQVPSCEFFPLEAVRTNVLGSANVIRAAVGAGVRGVVCLSTDKAVEPVNAMGMTKGLMEKVALAEAREVGAGGTIVSTVRYGNVLYSRGSVVPLFVQQAAAGVPLTVTDRRMTRFMMNLTEAVALVEVAMTDAHQGDLFVRKAPSATVVAVAEVTRRLLGSASEIEIVGVRHGEKLHETLATAAELRRATDCGSHLRIPMESTGLDYAKFFDEGELAPEVVDGFTSAQATQLNDSEIERMLLAVPEIVAAVADSSAATAR